MADQLNYVLNNFEFKYETVSKKIPNSRRISTAGKDKMYVSRIIAQLLNVQELTDRNI